MSWGISIMLGATLAQAAPPNAATRAAFVSSNAERWDVLVDDQIVCATPCTVPLSPLQFVVLGSQERRPVLLEVGRLPPGDFVVTGQPLRGGMYAGGIVATTFGGMALVTGITLMSVGLAKDRSGLSTAGFISGGAGALTLAGGIYLMLAALPSVRIDRAETTPIALLGGRF